MLKYFCTTTDKMQKKRKKKCCNCLFRFSFKLIYCHNSVLMQVRLGLGLLSLFKNFTSTILDWKKKALEWQSVEPLPLPRPSSAPLHSLLDLGHLNTPDFFHQHPCMCCTEIQENVWICNVTQSENENPWSFFYQDPHQELMGSILGGPLTHPSLVGNRSVVFFCNPVDNSIFIICILWIKNLLLILYYITFICLSVYFTFLIILIIFAIFCFL